MTAAVRDTDAVNAGLIGGARVSFAAAAIKDTAEVDTGERRSALSVAAALSGKDTRASAALFARSTVRARAAFRRWNADTAVTDLIGRTLSVSGTLITYTDSTRAGKA